MTGTDPKI